MENRLELNKRPVYELPDNTAVVSYVNTKKRKRNTNFIYDICITAMYNYIPSRKSNCDYQILIKTDNPKLIDFILNYDFNLIRSKSKISTRKGLKAVEVKKIILEEFYNKRA